MNAVRSNNHIRRQSLAACQHHRPLVGIARLYPMAYFNLSRTTRQVGARRSSPQSSMKILTMVEHAIGTIFGGVEGDLSHELTGLTQHTESLVGHGAILCKKGIKVPRRDEFRGIGLKRDESAGLFE